MIWCGRGLCGCSVCSVWRMCSAWGSCKERVFAGQERVAEEEVGGGRRPVLGLEPHPCRDQVAEGGATQPGLTADIAG